MTNPDLRAMLSQLIDAPTPQAFRSLLEEQADQLTSPEADAELALWIEEQAANSQAAVRLVDLRSLLTSLRRGRVPSSSARLYAAFASVANYEEMAALVQQLDEQALDAITSLAQDRIVEAQINEAQGIRERLECLRQIRAERSMSPLELAVQAYLRAPSEEHARAMLLAHPEALLAPAAGKELDGYSGANPESQAHIDARRALWQKTRMEHESGAS